MKKILLKSILCFILMLTYSVCFSLDKYVIPFFFYYAEQVLRDRVDQICGTKWTVDISNTTVETISVQKAGEFWWNFGDFERERILCPGEKESFTCYERGRHDNIMGFDIVILSDKGKKEDITIHYELIDPNRGRDFGDTIQCYAECYYKSDDCIFPMSGMEDAYRFIKYISPKHAMRQDVDNPVAVCVDDIADYPYRIGKSIIDNSKTPGKTGYYSDIGIRYNHIDNCIHCDVIVGAKKEKPPSPPFPFVLHTDIDRGNVLEESVKVITPHSL